MSKNHYGEEDFMILLRFVLLSLNSSNDSIACFVVELPALNSPFIPTEKRSRVWERSQLKVWTQLIPW